MMHVSFETLASTAHASIQLTYTVFDSLEARPLLDDPQWLVAVTTHLRDVFYWTTLSRCDDSLEARHLLDDPQPL